MNIIVDRKDLAFGEDYRIKESWTKNLEP